MHTQKLTKILNFKFISKGTYLAGVYHSRADTIATLHRITQDYKKNQRSEVIIFESKIIGKVMMIKKSINA